MNPAKGLQFGIGLAVFVSGVAIGGEKLIPEQQEVKQFVEKMYSYDPMTFSGGYFDVKTGSSFMRNRVPQNYKQLKFDPNKQCALLREFFDEAVITKDARPGRIGCDADYRYPNLGAEDMSSETRSIIIPAPRIEKLVVNGNRAKVSVLTEGGFELGRSLYFLVKTEYGWRVSNVMIQTRLPKPTDERDECYYSFAKRPSAEEFKEVASPCRSSFAPKDRPT